MVRVLIVFLVYILLIVQHADAKSVLKSVRARESRRKTRWERQETASSVVSTPVSAVVMQQQALCTNNKWAGQLCIFGGALGHLALGTLYCWGNFLSYIPTTLRFLDGADKAGPPDALYVVSLSLVAQAMAMPFGPDLTRKFGPGGAFLFGTWMMAAGTYLASFFTHDLKKFMIFYSLMFGAGSGFAYTAPMSAGWKWLPQSKGLVSGGILTGFGFGGLFFSLIGSSIANPMKVVYALASITYVPLPSRSF
jgi:MFS family permease